MIEFFKSNKADAAMLSKANEKWATRASDMMSSKMKELRRETRYYCADSKVHEVTNSDWLQRGMMSVITAKISSLIQHQQVKIGSLVKWMAHRVSNGKK